MMEILASNLSIILAGVLTLAGIVLTIYLKFPQLRYPFLSLKIILGTLDWSGTRGKITPGRSFSAGTLTAMIPGAFLGTLLAVLIAGPGVVVWIWIVSFFISPVHFVLSTAAHRSRKRTSSGSISGSVPDAVRQLTRSRWLSILSALFFIPAALLAGAALPVLFLSGGVSGAFAFRPGGDPLLPGPTAISILVAMGLVWITAGGIRRIGLYSKFTFYGGVLLLLISFLLGPLPEMGIIWEDIWRSFQDSGGSSLPATILGLTIYMALTETGSGKAAAISAAIRTDHPAKAGLSMQLTLLLESAVSIMTLLFLASISGAGHLYDWYTTSGAARQGFAQIFEPSLFDLFRAFFFRAPQSANVSGMVFLAASFLLIIPGITAWWYSLYHNALSLGGRKVSVAFSLIFFFTIVLTGLALDFLGPQVFSWTLAGTVLALMVASLSGAIAALIMMRASRNELNFFLESREAKAALAGDFFLILISVLPQNLISKVFGWFSLIPFPGPLRRPLIRAFASAYKINLEEAEKGLEEYPSLNAFFIRRLKEGVRPIDADPRSIVSPVDARASRFGKISEGLLIQTKGIYYTLKDLLGGSEETEHYMDGQYMVLYLSPQDYHRMHSPVECKIQGFNYAPGKLFPVNDIAVEGLHGLFPKNERLTSFLLTPRGRIAMIKVGATNVGKIRVTYDSIRTNRFFRKKRDIQYNPALEMAKGAEIGRFEMGSTVILLFERNTIEFAPHMYEGIKVKLGEPIAYFLRK
ncbi:MAG: phosphatidylserine decarboxylase [Leptospiraceae bacterium]|nr:phosphatidylserine decarboxylase [Leptospiraceae bacterium]MCB1169385.1 phosphatidylserine decarboxylase [Leptospiraceae bacterium]